MRFQISDKNIIKPTPLDNFSNFTGNGQNFHAVFDHTFLPFFKKLFLKLSVQNCHFAKSVKAIIS